MNAVGNFNQLLQAILVVAAIVAGAVWLRSQLVKQRHEELSELADTRGKRIEDLEARITAQGDRIMYLEGQVDAILKIKTEQIINGVRDGIHEIVVPIIREQMK